MAELGRQARKRIVIDAASSSHSRRPRPPRGYEPNRTRELWLAISIVAAAAVATFGALFLTSRPYDPMNATVAPQQVVPQGPGLTPSPKPSAPTTPSPQLNQSAANQQPPAPGGETSTAPPDDGAIESQIEKALASDPILSKLDVSTLVENGKVTIVGSVKSAELKQRVEKTIRSIRGVAGIDNQLVVTEATPS